MAPVERVTYNDLAWSLYAFELRDLAADLAIAPGQGVTYFVLLVSDPDERDTLYAEVFAPVVAALQPLR